MIAGLLLLAAANPLAGAWRVERIDAVLVDGNRAVPNEAVEDADHATGLIVYDTSGWMALEIGAGGRAADPTGPVGRRRAIPSGSFYAYYGRYEIDAGARIVRHHVVDSLMAPEIGSVAVRHYRIEGDRLTLTSDPVRRADGVRINRITFRRLAGATNTTPGTGQN